MCADYAMRFGYGQHAPGSSDEKLSRTCASSSDNKRRPKHLFANRVEWGPMGSRKQQKVIPLTAGSLSASCNMQNQKHFVLSDRSVVYAPDMGTPDGEM